MNDVSYWIGELGSNKADRRIEAVGQIANDLGPERVIAFDAILTCGEKDPDIVVRRSAMSHIEIIGIVSASFLHRIIKLLDDPDTVIRCRSSEALSNINSHLLPQLYEYIDDLIRRLATSDSGSRIFIANTLCRMIAECRPASGASGCDDSLIPKEESISQELHCVAHLDICKKLFLQVARRNIMFNALIDASHHESDLVKIAVSICFAQFSS